MVSGSNIFAVCCERTCHILWGGWRHIWPIGWNDWKKCWKVIEDRNTIAQRHHWSICGSLLIPHYLLATGFENSSRVFRFVFTRLLYHVLRVTWVMLKWQDMWHFLLSSIQIWPKLSTVFKTLHHSYQKTFQKRKTNHNRMCGNRACKNLCGKDQAELCNYCKPC